MYRVDAVSSLGASLTINADNTIRYNPSNSTTLQALLTGQSVWDTFTYTIKDSNGRFDTATVRVQVSGLDESTSLKLAANSVGTASSASSAAAILKSGTTAAAHDMVLGLATQDNLLGRLGAFYDLDLLSRSLKKSSSLAVDAVLRMGVL